MLVIVTADRARRCSARRDYFDTAEPITTPPPCIDEALQLDGQIATSPIQIATNQGRRESGDLAMTPKEEEYQNLDIMLHCADRQIATYPPAEDSIWSARTLSSTGRAAKSGGCHRHVGAPLALGGPSRLTLMPISLAARFRVRSSDFVFAGDLVNLRRGDWLPVGEQLFKEVLDLVTCAKRSACPREKTVHV